MSLYLRLILKVGWRVVPLRQYESQLHGRWHRFGLLPGQPHLLRDHSEQDRRARVRYCCDLLNRPLQGHFTWKWESKSVKNWWARRLPDIEWYLRSPMTDEYALQYHAMYCPASSWDIRYLKSFYSRRTGTSGVWNPDGLSIKGQSYHQYNKYVLLLKLRRYSYLLLDKTYFRTVNDIQSWNIPLQFTQ